MWESIVGGNAPSGHHRLDNPTFYLMPKILQAQHDFLALEFLNPRKLMNLFLVNFGGSTTVEVCQQIHSVFIYINISIYIYIYIYIGRSFALAMSSILHNLCPFPSNHGLSMRFIKDRFCCPPLFRFNFLCHWSINQNDLNLYENNYTWRDC